MEIILIYFAIKYMGDWNKIYEALEKKEKPEMDKIKTIEKEIENSDYKVITILDKNYPKELKRAYKPPFVIWAKGNLDLLKKQVVCVTGNKIDSATRKRLDKNILAIGDKFYILSPSFSGVDQEIKKLFDKSIIYVLTEGISKIGIDHNLFITEFPPQIDHPKRENFRQRNRIIAALSKELIVFSSDKNGGMNHLVSSFLNLGKEISCFPGDGEENDGNSELIKQGANLITSISEIC